MLWAVIAMQNEADALLSLSEIKASRKTAGKPVYDCVLGGLSFSVLVCGIGKANAAAGTAAAILGGADTILNFGLAGGITPKAAVGTVHCITEAVEYDFDLSEVNGTPPGTPDEFGGPFLPVSAKESVFPRSVLATGDRFRSGTEDLPLLASFGADIRDMEGAAVAHTALNAGVSCRIYKAVSDLANADSVSDYKKNTRLALNALTEALPRILSETIHG